MTKTEELILAAQRANPALSDAEIRQRLIENGVIKRGYYVEPELHLGPVKDGRASFISGFAAVKEGVVFCRTNTEQEAQQYLDNLRKADEKQDGARES